MAGSTIPVSIIGSRFAMSQVPFWTPENYSTSLPLHYLVSVPLSVFGGLRLLREVREEKVRVSSL